MDRMDEISEYPSSKDKIEPLAEILNDIDGELKLEADRMVLLYIRNSVMREASKIFQRIDDADARRVISSAIDKHKRGIEGISKTLNLRCSI
jgi:hypothetical protein